MTVDNNLSDRLHLRRSEISLGIVTPMANEEENAEAFVRDVLARCAPRVPGFFLSALRRAGLASFVI